MATGTERKTRYKLAKYEKETIFNFNQDDDMASVYTCDEAWMRHLAILAKKDARVVLEEADEYSQTYLIPKKAIKVHLSRILSALEREKRTLQLKKNFKK
jgi:hypothetical protein